MNSSQQPSANGFDLDQAVALAPQAAALGQNLAETIDRVVFIGCGASLRVLEAVAYWLNHFSTSFDFRTGNPAELIAAGSLRFDPRTLIVLGSQSGSTPEMLAAAERLSRGSSLLLAVTESVDRPLAKLSGNVLDVGPGNDFHAALYLNVLSLIGGLLSAKDGWPNLGDWITAVNATPNAMRVAADTAGRLAERVAEALMRPGPAYQVAAGPCFMPAYIASICMIAEMQQLPCQPIAAGDFFHGVLEIVDPETPIVVLLGEDPSRSLAERVDRFLTGQKIPAVRIDSRDFAMPGIAASMRPLVAPLIIDTVLNEAVERLAVKRLHPLSTRRYMGVVEY